MFRNSAATSLLSRSQNVRADRIGVLYGRTEILEATPPYHGGGEMIVSVTLEKSSYKKPPHRFEAGTPNIAGAIGLAAAIDYLEGIAARNF